MKVKLEKTKNIKEYENNPRKNDEAVSAVAASIKEFGFQQPIVVDKDNVVIAGHTRLKAARRLNLQDVPVVIADDLTDEQVRAFRIADNKTSELAEWNTAALFEELEGIPTINMEALGFIKEEPEPAAPEEEADGDLITLKFEFTPWEYEKVNDTLKATGTPEEWKGNKSRKGNQLFEVLKKWEEQKTFS